MIYPQIISNNEMQHGRIAALNDIQQGIAFDLNRSKSSHNTYYNSQLILTLNMDVVENSLDEAWQATANRHKDLFSLKLAKERGVITYPVKSSIYVPFYYYDISNKAEGEKHTYLDRLIEKDINTSFNLEIAPLMRVTLVKIQDSQYKLIWTKHHLLMDGSGSYLVLKSVFSIYHSVVKSEPSLGSADISDMILKGAQPPISTQGEASYWKHALSRHAEASNLFATENAFDNTSECSIEEADYSIGQQMLQSINQYAEKYSITLSSLLQGALALTHSVYSNSNDVAFGVVRRFPNRDSYGIGLHTNTVPVVISIDYNQNPLSFLESIVENNKSIRQFCTSALKNIKKWAGVGAERPLFQVLFDYKPKAIDAMLNEAFPDIHCESEFHLKIPYPFTVEIVNKGNSLSVTLSYDSNRFDREYVDTIFSTYQRMIRQLIDEETHVLSDISTLNKDESNKILVSWNQFNQQERDLPALHEQIAYYAKNTPDKEAIIYGDNSLCYYQLNARANQLARYLTSMGIGPESRVALCFSPSFMQYICMLAALKCGATIVPIDPTYPAARVSSMLVQSAAKTILTTSKLSKLFISDASRPIIELDSKRALWQSFNDDDLQYKVPMSLAAYIVFTSGSTGAPKGIVIEHRQWTAMLASTVNRLGVSNNERILQLSAFGFDVFQSEWGMALLSGASLCIFDNAPYSSKNIINALRDYSASLIICSSSILSSLPQVELPALKTVAIGGEPCDKSTLDFWSRQLKIYHVYGVTEAAICSTIGDYSPNQKKLHIGKPLGLVKIYIFNSRMEPCPVNVPGEMYIGGAGVARGYLDQEQTEKKFIRHVINGKTERLYKTGDLAKWLSSGDIEFIGRIDYQVKIRGHRIELAEIDEILMSIAGVAKACTVVIENENKKNLISYLKTNECLSVDNVKSSLSKTLPSYMVPHRIELIDSFPLTAHGKINRKQLVSKAKEYIERNSNVSDTTSDSSDSKIAKNIKRLVKNLLNIKEIPMNRNFFDIGLDSISLSSLQISIEELFSIELNMVDLLTYSTVETLSHFISKRELHDSV